MGHVRALLSFRGRLPRAAFWWRALALWAAFVVLFVALEHTLGRVSTFVLYPPFFWIGLALCAKRLRDRGYAPGWLAAALVPVAGPLWLAIELGVRRGTHGENAYGPDPLQSRAGYLTVQ
ncbi:MAG: DUF805 domain-containing protein [Burkholderiales bacterium]|nr:DUF805 domain-containing protein [Burkholderiales bacterium]